MAHRYTQVIASCAGVALFPSVILDSANYQQLPIQPFRHLLCFYIAASWKWDMQGVLPVVGNPHGPMLYFSHAQSDPGSRNSCASPR